MDTKYIEYYVREVYGNTLEYLKHPVNAGLIFRITGKKTINRQLRNDLESLSGFRVKFVEVIR